MKAVQAEQERIAGDLLALIDTANAPIFGIDSDGRVNEWNRKAAQIVGYEKDEVMGQLLVEKYISPDFKDSVGTVLENALAGRQTDNFEFPLFTKTGERVEVLLNATTRRDAAGAIVGVVGVGQDITAVRPQTPTPPPPPSLSSSSSSSSSNLTTTSPSSTSASSSLPPSSPHSSTPTPPLGLVSDVARSSPPPPPASR